jgi:hypothetical protein
MIKVKNIRELGIKTGFLGEGKYVDNLLNVFKRFFKTLNIPFYDELNTDSTVPLPVGYTDGDGIVRYNPGTKEYETVSVGGGPTPVVNTYPVTTSGLAGTLFWYKANLWHYMTQAEIDAAAWTGAVSVGFPAPVAKIRNNDIIADYTGTVVGSSPVNYTIIDILGYGNPVRIYQGFGFDNDIAADALVRNAQLLTNVRDLGTEFGINLRFRNATAITLNSFFTGLPSTSNSCTIDVRNTPGALTCNPAIATAKGYTVVTA